MTWAVAREGAIYRHSIRSERDGSSVGSNPRMSAAHPGGSLVDVSAVERFAAEFHKEHKGHYIQTDRLGGFCLLLRREVVVKIGPALNDWSDLSLFDTDILSTKADQAGYKLAVCRDLFVHHFGTRTFAHGPPKTNTNSVQA